VTADGGNAKDVTRYQKEPTVRQRIRATLQQEAAAQWLVKRVLGDEAEPSAMDVEEAREIAAKAQGEEKA